MSYLDRYRDAGKTRTAARPIPSTVVVAVVDRWRAHGNRVPEDCARQLHRFRDDDDMWVGHRTADRVVTGTVGPQAWVTEPELRACDPLPEPLLSDAAIAAWAVATRERYVAAGAWVALRDALLSWEPPTVDDRSRPAGKRRPGT